MPLLPKDDKPTAEELRLLIEEAMRKNEDVKPSFFTMAMQAAAKHTLDEQELNWRMQQALGLSQDGFVTVDWAALPSSTAVTTIPEDAIRAANSEYAYENPYEFLRRFYQEQNTMSQVQIASVMARYDYSPDVGFAFPDKIDASTYDPSSIFSSQRRGGDNGLKSFKDLVFKGWGKLPIEPDPSKSGGYCFPRNSWLKHETRTVLTRNHPGIEYDLPYQYSFIDTIGSVFYANDQSEAALLSLSYGHQTLVLLLVNRQVAKRLPKDDSVALFNEYSTFEIDLPNTKVPFPFNQYGDYNSHVAHHNKANVHLAVELHEGFGLTLIAHGDYRSGNMKIMTVPDALHHAFAPTVSRYLHRTEQMRNRRNPFNAIAEVLVDAQESGYLELETGVLGELPPDPQGDTEFILTAMSNAIHTVGDLSAIQRKVSIATFEPPFGLDNLPKPPDKYRWIGDVFGIVYLVNVDDLTLKMPFEVFDLQNIFNKTKGFFDALEAGEIPDDDYSYKDYGEVMLLYNLYKHQADLFKSLRFNYTTFNLSPKDVNHIKDMLDSDE